MIKKSLWLNLAVRLVLLAFVLFTGRWWAGDTYHYLVKSAAVCRGEWGGDPIRTPLYLWYLCGLSPGLGATGPEHWPTAAQLALPLFLQTLAVWVAGVYLAKKIDSKIAQFWLWDPVLLGFSFLIMSDVLFSLSLLALSLTLLFARSEGWKKKKGWQQSLLIGVVLAAAMLTRPIGIPIGAFTLLLFAYWAFRKQFSWRVVLASFAVVLALLSPRLYWDYTRYNFIGLANQGPAWLGTVAAVVENHGSGLNPQQAEAEWWKKHQPWETKPAMETLVTHFPTTVLLTVKGALRVFFGHANMIWGYLALGTAPVGPNWFRVPETRNAPKAEGATAVLWALGWLAVLAELFYVYGSVAREGLRWLKSTKRTNAGFVVWALVAIGLLAFTPLVWGDERFRMPIWPVLLMLWACFLGARAKQRATSQ